MTIPLPPKPKPLSAEAKRLLAEHPEAMNEIMLSISHSAAGTVAEIASKLIDKNLNTVFGLGAMFGLAIGPALFGTLEMIGWLAGFLTGRATE